MQQHQTPFTCLSSSDQIAMGHYLRYLQRKNAPRTQRNKQGQLQRFFRRLSLTHPIELAQITPVHIDQFIQNAQQQGYAPGSINCYLHTLHNCFGFLQEAEFLPSNPVKPKRHFLSVPLHLPKPMAREDVRKLFAAVNTPRERALFLVALCCGLRVSEIVHLKLSDIDWERHTLRVNQGKTKADRVVYLTAEVEASLRAWLALRVCSNEYVFCSQQSRSGQRPMSRRHLNRLLKAALQRAGVDPARYSFHSLRHTFATELLNAGISLRCLQELLGHKSLQEVLIYAQLYETTKRQEFYQAMASLEAHSELVTVGGV